ncbi:MAG: hypothetical protein ACK53Y_27840 [bacterium]
MRLQKSELLGLPIGYSEKRQFADRWHWTAPFNAPSGPLGTDTPSWCSNEASTISELERQ